MIDIYKLPEGYPDEWFYSILARYMKSYGELEASFVIRKLLNQPRSAVSLRGKEIFKYLDNTPTESRSLEFFIKNHTFVPFIKRYHSKSSKINLYKNLHQKKIRFGRFSVQQKCLRYCPLCVEEDIKKYGETYWHRLHQIPGVNYCSLHDCSLENSQSLLKKQLYFAHKVICPSRPNRNFTQIDKKVEPYFRKALFSDFSFFKDKPVVSISEFLYKKTSIKYWERNDIKQKLLNDMMEFYGDEYYSQFFGNENATYFISNLANRNNSQKTEPVLLVSAFLNIPIDSLFEE